MSTRRGSSTQVAKSTPFNDSGFTSTNAQDAIIEAKQNAEGFPRAGLPLIYNGTVGNNDLISYSNLTPSVPIVFPVNTKLNELTFANAKTSVECDIEIWKDGVDTGTLVKTINISTGVSDNDFFDVNSDNITFNAGQIVQLKYIDQGTNASDLVIVLWISRIP